MIVHSDGTLVEWYDTFREEWMIGGKIVRPLRDASLELGCYLVDVGLEDDEVLVSLAPEQVRPAPGSYVVAPGEMLTLIHMTEGGQQPAAFSFGEGCQLLNTDDNLWAVKQLARLRLAA
jgi:hypothetical protein